jgi:hypothetical protein
MATSKAIADLIGPTLVALATGMLLNLGSFTTLAEQISRRPALTLVSGVLLFVAGLAIRVGVPQLLKQYGFRQFDESRLHSSMKPLIRLMNHRSKHPKHSSAQKIDEAQFLARFFWVGLNTFAPAQHGNRSEGTIENSGERTCACTRSFTLVPFRSRCSGAPVLPSVRRHLPGGSRQEKFNLNERAPVVRSLRRYLRRGPLFSSSCRTGFS